MAYQTGSAASPAALRTALYAFATANGWTDTSGVLSQGSSYVRLTAIDAEKLEIEGDTDGAFTAGACPQKAKINIESTAWPVTYRFFAFSSPEYLAAVLQYDVTRIQMIWAGSIVKYGNWVCGNWFGASAGEQQVQPEKFLLSTLTSGGTFYNGSLLVTNNAPAAPFWGTPNRESFNGGFQANRASFVHAEIDGQVWPGASQSDEDLKWPSYPLLTSPLHLRQPNVWNSQTILLAYRLFLERADTFHSPIGHLAYMRALRIDNYNIGEIIDIPPDKWMVFPFHKKDISARDGGLNPNQELNHTGTFGVAISYDGP